MGRARKPVVEQPEIVLTRGMPLVLGEAPNGKALSAAFLADFARDYESYGKAIFELMRQRYPVVYFNFGEARASFEDRGWPGGCF